MKIRNFSDMHQAMGNWEPFQHRSYRAETTGSDYALYHWKTLIAVVNDDGIPVYSDLGYYSTTTSRFQGEILRHVLSDKGRETVLELFADNKPQYNRLKRMMW